MRTLFLATAIFFSMTTQAVETDKVLHFGASTLIGTASYNLTGDWRYALAGCLAVGLVKEGVDQYRYQGFDGKDMLANALGCNLGVAASYLLDKKVHISGQATGDTYSLTVNIPL